MAKDEFTRDWIIENSLEIIERYDPGVLTLRALHYQLVSIGMTNTMQHYKRVVTAMIKARRDGRVPYDTFSDHDRSVLGETNADIVDLDDAIEKGKYQVKAWMRNFYRNKWENQNIYPEVWIEKKALQGVFEEPCEVALAPCKGYPSLTFLYEASLRFKRRSRQGKSCVILYFGDYDATGEDIPRSIQDNLTELGADVEVRRISLMEHQVLEWGLPPAPTKATDTRAKNWDGLGQVELDAVEPKKLMKMVAEAIEDVFDEELHSELLETQSEQKQIYVAELKHYVNNEL